MPSQVGDLPVPVGVLQEDLCAILFAVSCSVVRGSVTSKGELRRHDTDSSSFLSSVNKIFHDLSPAATWRMSLFYDERLA